MKRRTLLSVSATVMLTLAGCLGTDSPERTPPDEQRAVQGTEEHIEAQGEKQIEPANPTRECQELAVEAVSEHVEAHYQDSTHLVFSLDEHPDRDGDIVCVEYIWLFDTEEDLESVPPFAFDDIVEVTPQTVNVTLTLPEEQHECDMPVYVNDVFLRQGV